MAEKDGPGRVLKAWRTRSPRRSQEQVAEAVGVSQGAISHYENALDTPSRRVALKIDAYLGAGGEIVRAFGYSVNPVPPPSDEWRDRLQEQVDELQAQVGQLLGLVAAQGAAIDQLIARGRREDDDSS